MLVRFVITILLFLLTFSSVAMSDEDRKKVLLINSYHVGFGWQDDITRGVKDVLKNSGLETELYVDYLDTSRYTVEQMKPKMDFIMLQKYKDTDLDVIIVADDNGLQHLIDTKMYEKAPVVFLGINSLERVDVARNLGMTGVIETVEFKKTLELILELHPNVERIIPIAGLSSTAKIHLQNLKIAFQQLKTDVQYEDIGEWSFDSLKKKLKAYDPATTALVQMSFHNDYFGNISPSIDPYRFFYQFDIPGYTMWVSHGIGDGMLGGFVSDGYEHGKLAAEKAMAILRGVSPLDLTVDSGTRVNYPLFDYMLLQKYGIHRSRLPERSVVLNIPQSFYQEYYGTIWVGLSLFVFISVAFLFAFIQMKDRDRLSKIAQENYDEMLIARQKIERSTILSTTEKIREECPNIDVLFQTLDKLERAE